MVSPLFLDRDIRSTLVRHWLPQIPERAKRSRSRSGVDHLRRSALPARQRLGRFPPPSLPQLHVELLRPLGRLLHEDALAHPAEGLPPRPATAIAASLRV